MSFPSTEQHPECPNKLDFSGNLLYSRHSYWLHGEKNVNHLSICKNIVIKTAEENNQGHLRATGRLISTFGAYFFCFLSLYFSCKNSIRFTSISFLNYNTHTQFGLQKFPSIQSSPQSCQHANKFNLSTK